MRPIRLLLPLALLAVPTIAKADPREELTARYAELKAAMEAHNADAAKALLAPRFKSVDIRGNELEAEDLIDDMARIPADPARKSETVLGDIKLDGDKATVAHKLDAKSTRKGEDGAEHAIEFVSTSTDVWVRTPKGWLMQSSTAEEVSILRDGTEVRHFKRGEQPAG
jgi:hypothetical protein